MTGDLSFTRSLRSTFFVPFTRFGSRLCTKISSVTVPRCRVDGTKFEIIAQTEDTVEISFVRSWENSTYSYVSPLIIDKR